MAGCVPWTGVLASLLELRMFHAQDDLVSVSFSHRIQSLRHIVPHSYTAKMYLYLFRTKFLPETMTLLKVQSHVA